MLDPGCLNAGCQVSEVRGQRTENPRSPRLRRGNQKSDVRDQSTASVQHHRTACPETYRSWGFFGTLNELMLRSEEATRLLFNAQRSTFNVQRSTRQIGVVPLRHWALGVGRWALGVDGICRVPEIGITLTPLAPQNA